jgi:hypothetical protein
LRDRDAERLGGLHVDDQLELGRLFYRQVARPGAFEYLVHEMGGATKQRSSFHAVADQAASLGENVASRRKQPVRRGKLGDSLAARRPVRRGRGPLQLRECVEQPVEKDSR